MEPVLTLDEIHTRFPAEWVLVGDPELTPELQVVRGNVLWHCKDRDELYAKASELRPRHSAFVYTGGWPEGMEYVLSAIHSTREIG